MDKTISRFFILIVAILSGMLACFALSSQPVFATENSKKYEYTITQENNLFVLSGAYENGGTYSLGASETIEGALRVVDYDRQIDGEYQDIKLNFNNLNVGKEYIELTKGNIVLTGSIVGANYSSYGLVYVRGANVVFEELNLENNGLSYLVRNDGSGDLTFVSGQYSSLSTTIISKGPADVVITGGSYSSQYSSVIDFVPSSIVAKLDISAQTQQTNITARSETSPAIRAQNAVVEIGGGTIKNLANGPAIILEDVLCSLTNNAHVSGGDIDLETNQKILANGYNGSEITVNFNGTIVPNETIVVEGLDENLFVLKNEGFTLSALQGNLVAFKTFTLTYVDTNNYLRFVPVENQQFMAGDVVEVKMPSSASFKNNVLNLVNFLGWSEDPLAQSPTYTDLNDNLTFPSQNITLYAVWENREYHINYLGIEDAINPNELEYTTNQEITFENAEKRYYKFTGWIVNGVGSPQIDLVLPATTYGDLTLTATWQLETYNIIYNGLPSAVIQGLNLPITYTIESAPLEINLERVLALGYTYFGVYLDENKSVFCDEIIYFQPNRVDDNSDNFNAINRIGEDINIYIDAKAYYNGAGAGTAENPFMISNLEQFKALMIGTKIKADKPIVVALANDITVNERFLENSKLSDFVLDGNGNTIFVETLTNVDGVMCVLPSIENAEVKNLVVKSEPRIVYASAKTNFSGFAGKILDAKIQNLEIDMPTKFVCDGISTVSTIKFGGLTLLAQNSTFDGVKNSSNFEVAVLSAGGDVNIYGAGLVGFSAENCLFVNCKQTGDISAEIGALPYETHTYFAGLACVDDKNKIINCLNAGGISLVQAGDNQAVLCGLVMPFGVDNQVKNVAVTKNIVAESTSKVIVESISLSTCEKTNVFAASDFTANNQTNTLKKLVSSLDALQQEYGIELYTWFVGENGLDFTKGVYVHFKGGEMMQDKTLYFATPQDARNAYLWFDTNEYLFYGWKTESGEDVDWENVYGPEITVVAEYALFKDLIFQEQMKVVLIEALVLLAVVFIMWLFDRKKPVYFIRCGRPIGMVKVGRTKPVPMPKEFEGKICFKDEAGKKPFLKNKMPCHKLTLYVFDEFKQSRLENALKSKEQNQKQLALNEIILKGIMRARRKEIKKSRALRQKQQAEVSAKTPLQKDGAGAVKVNAAQNQITIIKKEIKVLKNQDSEKSTEKNKKNIKKNKK